MVQIVAVFIFLVCFMSPPCGALRLGPLSAFRYVSTLQGKEDTSETDVQEMVLLANKAALEQKIMKSCNYRQLQQMGNPSYSNLLEEISRNGVVRIDDVLTSDQTAGLALFINQELKESIRQVHREGRKVTFFCVVYYI
jgi:hypothetical protein